MRKVFFMTILPGLVLGCARRQPTLSGGKPVEHWIQALKDPDARVRQEAAFKLGNAGPVDAAVLPALVAALNDPDARVRSEAVLAVVKFGPAAKEAAPALTELGRNDRDPRVRRYCVQALEKIQPGD
jgi:HEAT repeat protein